MIHTSRSRERNCNRALPVWGNARGATLIYVLVLIGVLFGFMSLAIDLGRIYVIQGELQTAADAGALAAAMRLNGTANSATHAADQFATTFDTTSLNDNRFNLGLSQIGIPGTTLTTEISTDYFATVADARLNTNGGQTGDQARYVRAEVRAEAPVSFEAAPGARPVFSGGRRIVGFQPGANGIWTANVPEVAAGRWYFEQLWVNGQRVDQLNEREMMAVRSDLGLIFQEGAQIGRAHV